MASDFSGLIPLEFARQIIQEATVQSAGLTLGNVQRMSSKQQQIPVLSALPTAAFVGANNIKPATEVSWTAPLITAEEVAAVIPVPNAMIEDSAFPLWGEIRPLLGQAIAVAVDAALFTGTGAPASFPAGGLLAGAGPPIAVDDDLDLITAIGNAMGVVENSGLDVTGHAARNRVKASLRAVRSTTGEFILIAPTDAQGTISSIYGVPIAYTRTGFGAHASSLVTGDWTKLVIGLREDIRFDTSTDGVLRNPATGAVTVSAFQDDVTIMRVYMRLGAVIGRPVTVEGGLGRPFQSVSVPAPAGAADPPPDGGADGDGDGEEGDGPGAMLATSAKPRARR